MKFCALPIFLGLLSNVLVNCIDESQTDATGLVLSYSPGISSTAVSIYERFKDRPLEGPSVILPAGPVATTAPISTDRLLSVGTTVFAANRFQNTIWMYDLSGEPRLLDTVGSGGLTPCSFAYSKNILYVLNCAWNFSGNVGTGIPSVTAFSVVPEDKEILKPLPKYTREDKQEDKGILEPLPEYTRALDAYESLGGTQIEVTPDGKFLLVAIQGQPSVGATNQGALLTFSLDGGIPSDEPTEVLSGINWFAAFEMAEFNGQTFIYVESLNDASVAPYRLETNGSLTPVGPAVVGPPQGADAALCWLYRVRNYLYGTNFGTSTITSWKINETDGSVSLLEEAAGGANGHRTFVKDPATNITISGLLDMVASEGILYVLEPSDNAPVFLGILVPMDISSFVIEDDGSLTFSSKTNTHEANSGLAVIDLTPAPTNMPTPAPTPASSSASAASPLNMMATIILAIVGGLLL